MDGVRFIFILFCCLLLWTSETRSCFESQHDFFILVSWEPGSSTPHLPLQNQENILIDDRGKKARTRGLGMGGKRIFKGEGIGPWVEYVEPGDGERTEVSVSGVAETTEK
jgi:hypothetical protein